MTREEAKKWLNKLYARADITDEYGDMEDMQPYEEAVDMAIEALEQEPRKGQWLRMSDLSEQKDDRYKCSRCGNVVHYNDKMNLYTFNSWCGRCGSDNGKHINYEVEE